MNPVDRRTFLLASGAAVSALVTGCHSRDVAGRVDTTPYPCAPGRWRKHGIVLEATEPWEGDDVQNFTARAEPLGKDDWRLWYSVSGGRAGYTIAYAEGSPGERMRKVPAVLSAGDPADAPFAIGNLPDKWRPIQPVHIRLRNGRHRLYFWVHGPGVTRYLAAESDDGRRYRVIDPLRPVLYHPYDRAAAGRPAPDGVVLGKLATNRPADEPPALSRLLSNDATNLYQLPDGTFEMYSVGLVKVDKSDPAYVAEDNAPGLLRVIDRYTSGDGLNFETRQRIITRDAGDPADQQFYYLAVTHTPRGRVGMLGHYRCRAQTMDLEWCHSHDGVEWRRPFRSGWLTRGNPPAPDCFGLYGGSQLVQRNGRWHLFYTGVNSTHNGREAHGKPRQVVMHASTDSIWSDR